MISTKQSQDAKGMDFIQFEEKGAETNIALAMLRSRAISWPSGEVSNSDSSIWKENAVRRWNCSSFRGWWEAHEHTM